jgi:3-deoxy-manno-octulosonate cytidylyltransferase (CMP-KDO synthetase)
MQNVALIIPSRLGSTRLPQKPLAKIGSMTMIEHVVLAAMQSDIEAIYVATDSKDIAYLAEARGAKAIITDKECASGTDRVFHASQIANLQHEVIINLQGDMPFVDPQVIKQVATMCLSHDYDITTAISPSDNEYAQSKSNVKAIVNKHGKALYFSREMIPHNALQYFCHIGIYAFKNAALRKFCSLPISDIEKAESLEQLRALDNGMTIGACQANEMPISVDTPEDLQKAIDLFNLKHKLNN